MSGEQIANSVSRVHSHVSGGNTAPGRGLFATLFTAFVLTMALAGCSSQPASPAQSLSFAFGGDVAGQNVCRDATLGFPVFRQIQKRRPDFFVALGDMIYADQLCESVGLYGNAQIPRETGLATSPEEFSSHWQYVRADPGFYELLQNTPYFAVWDDHEVQNDFGPRTADESIIAASKSAFASLHGRGKDVLYYQQRFGDQLELFFLDTRSYRDANLAADLPDAPKTMLGAQQKAWLTESVSNSSATWKVIVTSVPLSIPTGWPPEHGRDGWANFDQDTGFERELLEILREFASRNIRNLIFITADVHFATAFRYRPFDAYPDFSFHEFVVGPLNAGLFPGRDVDDTLKPERLFFYGPESGVTDLRYAEALQWFNFGLIRIDEAQQLAFQLVDAHGETRAQLTVSPN